jgi:hypothetical protein
MSYSSLSSQFYFNQLPKFLNILKDDLKNENCFTLKENITVFLNFFKNFSAYNYFQKDLIISDDMYFSFDINSWESKIRLQRNLQCDCKLDEDFLHETYQIQFELGLNLEYNGERINESFDLSRNRNNEFEVWQYKIIKFEDYENLIFDKLNNFKNLIPEYPSYVCLNLNADV